MYAIRSYTNVAREGKRPAFFVDEWGLAGPARDELGAERDVAGNRLPLGRRRLQSLQILAMNSRVQAEP